MPDEQLSGRELNAVIAERVMAVPEPPRSEAPHEHYSITTHKSGCWIWHYGNNQEGQWEPMPFSESIEAAMKVEDRIAELGLCRAYIESLYSVIAESQNLRVISDWDIVHASAEERCRAAWAAIETKDE